MTRMLENQDYDKAILAALPDQPSALLRVALADLEKCETDPSRFRINMNTWFSPSDNKSCEVCMAGAVMAQSLGAGTGFINKDGDRHLYGYQGFAGTPFANKMTAIDGFREGYIEAAFADLKVSPLPQFARPYKVTIGKLNKLPDDVLPSIIRVKNYHANPAKFKRQMTKLADFFESRGF